MRLNNDVFEVVFVMGTTKEEAYGFLLDKDNATAVQDQMLSVQKAEICTYIFRTVEDDLMCLAADEVKAIKLKVHVDAEDLKDVTPTKQDALQAQAAAIIDGITQGKGEKPTKVGRRPRLVGFDQTKQ